MRVEGYGLRFTVEGCGWRVRGSCVSAFYGLDLMFEVFGEYRTPLESRQHSARRADPSRLAASCHPGCAAGYVPRVLSHLRQLTPPPSVVDRSLGGRVRVRVDSGGAGGPFGHDSRLCGWESGGALQTARASCVADAGHPRPRSRVLPCLLNARNVSTPPLVFTLEPSVIDCTRRLWRTLSGAAGREVGCEPCCWRGGVENGTSLRGSLKQSGEEVGEADAA